jgi:hypothetical protein
MDVIESTRVEQDGITYKVLLAADEDTSIEDADGYNDEDRAAYERDDWGFVGVIVQPVIDGVVSEDAEDSLWGVQYGHSAEWDSGLDYLVSTYPVPSMISEVRHNLRKLRERLAGISLDDCTAYNPAEGRPNVANAMCLRALSHDGLHRDLDGREWPTADKD